MGMDSNIEAEPMPKGNGQTVVFQVVKDLCNRSAVGAEKYGTLLKIDNGREALIDAYQEAMDLTMYLKQALMENQQREKEYTIKVDKTEGVIALYVNQGENKSLELIGKRNCKIPFESIKTTAFEFTISKGEE